jgi:hypothetical protein
MTRFSKLLPPWRTSDAPPPPPLQVPLQVPLLPLAAPPL